MMIATVYFINMCLNPLHEWKFALLCNLKCAGMLCLLNKKGFQKQYGQPIVTPTILGRLWYRRSACPQRADTLVGESGLNAQVRCLTPVQSIHRFTKEKVTHLTKPTIASHTSLGVEPEAMDVPKAYYSVVLVPAMWRILPPSKSFSNSFRDFLGQGGMFTVHVSSASSTSFPALTPGGSFTGFWEADHHGQHDGPNCWSQTLVTPPGSAPFSMSSRYFWGLAPQCLLLHIRNTGIKEPRDDLSV